jgi:hypothetical protein
MHVHVSHFNSEVPRLVAMTGAAMPINSTVKGVWMTIIIFFTFFLSVGFCTKCATDRNCDYLETSMSELS